MKTLINFLRNHLAFEWVAIICMNLLASTMLVAIFNSILRWQSVLICIGAFVLCNIAIFVFAWALNYIYNLFAGN